jgi:hypothetical protein
MMLPPSKLIRLILLAYRNRYFVDPVDSAGNFIADIQRSDTGGCTREYQVPRQQREESG